MSKQMKTECVSILENFGLDELCKFWVYYMPEINHICLHWNNDKQEAIFSVDGQAYWSILVGEL